MLGFQIKPGGNCAFQDVLFTRNAAAGKAFKHQDIHDFWESFGACLLTKQVQTEMQTKCSQSTWGQGTPVNIHLWGHVAVRTAGLQDKPHRFSCVNSFCLSQHEAACGRGAVFSWFFNSPLKSDTGAWIMTISGLECHCSPVSLCEQGLKWGWLGGCELPERDPEDGPQAGVPWEGSVLYLSVLLTPPADHCSS